ncbi:MAG TPA: hypothetical protein PLN42_09665 [Anaerolineae bacterium]|nr:hypothetical protein [Anaerolineae bacterium]
MPRAAAGVDVLVRVRVAVGLDGGEDVEDGVAVCFKVELGVAEATGMVGRELTFIDLRRPTSSRSARAAFCSPTRAVTTIAMPATKRRRAKKTATGWRRPVNASFLGRGSSLRQTVTGSRQQHARQNRSD